MRDEENNVDADTSLVDLDIPRLSRINNDINTGRIKVIGDDETSVFAANNLLKKTRDNLAKAEAMVNEIPMRTENTAKLEESEDDEQ